MCEIDAQSRKVRNEIKELNVQLTLLEREELFDVDDLRHLNRMILEHVQSSLCLFTIIEKLIKGE